MQDYTQKTFYRAGILILGFGSMFYLFFFNAPKDNADNVYEPKKFDHANFNHIHLKEMSSALGVNYTHKAYQQAPGHEKEIDLSIEPPIPSLSAIDINEDGWTDLFITTNKGKPNLLYINHNGKYFTEEAAAYGLADLNKESAPSFALWGDFNNDGKTDLLFARNGCHGFFLGNGKGKFEEHSEWLNGYCSRPDGVNTADMYRHGKLDLVFGNYLPAPGEHAADALWMTNTRYDNSTGGKNQLLKNDGHSFVLEKNANFLTRSYTHNVGIADINLDGLPDIFFANDYAHDEMFLNKGDGFFTDVTNEYIPREVHGLAGMNTEFFDFNEDGLLDLYVTNIFKPPFNRHFNLLWKKKADNTFENVSTDVGTAKCGFSWGAKFADIDNDGEPDLLVVNGRSRSSIVKKPNEGKSMWYERTEVSQIPNFLKRFYHPHDSLKGRYISAFERKCLFVQKNGKFFDVAEEAGFNDREENRSIALFDFDNDGRVDAVTAGPLAKIKIYHNESIIEKDHHWIGFSFKDKVGSVIPHGLKIEFSLDNKKKIVRELYPANGYKGFNEPRIHVGLGSAKISGDIKITWPLSKKIQTVKKIKIDSYNSINEKDSE
jgi:hypothetical protein